LIDRPTQEGERAILVHLDLHVDLEHEQLNEFEELARSAGVTTVDIIKGRRRSPDPAYFVGLGKAQEIRDRVYHTGADLVLFNHSLTPSQERNLEKLLHCRVIDRTGLILDIFAQRARSFEGKLQVELAQLKHLSTRLIRGWTHLERQKGGIGLRGPGETQLETDRRLIVHRIKQLKRKLRKVHEQRQQGKQSRKRNEVPTVSLVGYTNAGKSTLFNKLTSADVYQADKLFATLDPTIRRLQTEQKSDVVVSDTVGFIRHLPHDLVNAFHSTLEEIKDADLLLHVIDASEVERSQFMDEVEQVLTEIGANEVPQIKVYNKIDRMETEPHVDYDADGNPVAVWVSAMSGQGVDLLKQIVLSYLFGEFVRKNLRIEMKNARVRAKLHELNVVQEETTTQDGDWLISIEMTKSQFEKLIQQEKDCVEVLNDDTESLATRAYAS
jgi:GTP-binding protein HflX